MSGDGDLLNFLYACPVGLLEFDREGTIGMVNPHAMKLLMPLARAGMLENLFDAFERDAPELRNLVHGYGSTHGTIRDGHRICLDLGGATRTGRPQVISCTLVRLGPNRFMATLSDISAQVAQEHRLSMADAWFSALVDEINDYAVIDLTADGRIEGVNRSFAGQTGWSVETVLGRSIREIIDEPNDTGGITFSLEDQFTIAARDGWVLHESWQSRANGVLYWCQRLIIARYEDEAHTAAYSMILRDVPPRDSNSGDLVAILTQDHLTGATNRMQFQKTLQHERLKWCKFGGSVSLVLFDLDFFKSINDRYGHAGGDAVLCEVVRVGLSVAPPGSTLARIGGEEFALLLPKTDLETAEWIANDLRRAIAKLCIGEAGITVTASFGCAELSETAGATDKLIELADNRLYSAKRAGRDRVLAAAG